MKKTICQNQRNAKNSISSIIILGTITLLCLSSCANPTNNGTQNNSPDKSIAQATIPSLIEPSASHNNHNEQSEVVASSEIINAALYSDVVQIGNMVIRLPAKYTDFIAAGAICVDKSQSEDYLMDAGATAIIDMKIGSTVFQLYMINASSERSTLKETNAIYIYSSKGPEVFFPTGIKAGDKLSDLIDSWGQPSLDSSASHDEQLTYTYMEYPVAYDRVHDRTGFSFGVKPPTLVSATGIEYIVYIDRNTSIISSIQCKWVDRSTQSSHTNISKEYKYLNGTVVAFSFQIPSALTKKIIAGDKSMSIYVFDNEPYIVVLDANFGITATSKGVTDENLLSVISEIDSNQYDAEIIINNGVEGIAIGYYHTDSSVECAIVYINEARRYITTGSKIMPFDEHAVLTEAAIDAFKEMMVGFASSIKEN